MEKPTKPQPQPPQLDERRTKFILFLGYNGTGKSTLAQRFVEAECKRGGRALIVTPDPVEWQKIQETQLLKPALYKGAKKLIYTPQSLPLIRENYNNGLLLLFDDCRAFLKVTKF
jgi:hypothetical protein